MAKLKTYKNLRVSTTTHAKYKRLALKRRQAIGVVADVLVDEALANFDKKKGRQPKSG